MWLGMRTDNCLSAALLSKHQFYYPLNAQRVGRQGTTRTRWKDMATSYVKEVNNKEVVDEIVTIKLNPDLPKGYLMIARYLQMVGFVSTIKRFTHSCVYTCSWKTQGSELGVIL
jgi:hypothetical protein